jgi:hypothetical protein
VVVPSEVIKLKVPRLLETIVQVPPVIATLVLTPLERLMSSTPLVTAPLASTAKTPAMTTLLLKDVAESKPLNRNAKVPPGQVAGGGAAIVTLTVVEWLAVPNVAVMLTGNVPGEAVLLAVTVSVTLAPLASTVITGTGSVAVTPDPGGTESLRRRSIGPNSAVAVTV